MLSVRNGLMVLIMTAVSFMAGAQEIYKTVNEDGVVEYSDMPTPEAQEVEVKPNVVEVTPAKPADPASDVPPPESGEVTEPSQQADEVYEADNLVRDRDLAKKRAIENNNQAVEGPVHKGGRPNGARRR